MENNALYVNEKIPASQKINRKMNFKQYSEMWLKESFDWNYITEKTYSRYTDLLKRINLGIGHISLSKLETYHIKAFINNLRQPGQNKITGKCLSDKTVLHHYRLISVILQQATREKLIPINPASKDIMRAPKVIETKQIESLQIDEITILISSLRLEPIKWSTAVLLLLLLGLRRGELCGLEWQDIDFTNKALTIARESLYSSQVGIYTKEPKTKSSIRTFAISDTVLAIFFAYREWYIETYGITDLNEKRLFIQNNLKPIHPDSITDWLSKFSKKYNLSKIYPHLLRHTYISLMVSKGVSIKEIGKRVGHTQLSTTFKYTHSITTADVIAAEALDDVQQWITERK